MSLTLRDKLAIVLIRLENTAGYFIAGWLIGKIAPQFFWLFFAIVVIGFALETIFYSRFTKYLAFAKNADEDELFADFVTITIPTCVAYFVLGFLTARIL